MIWEYALDVQRTIIVDQNYYANSKLRTTEILEDYPAMLQLCRESRAIALKKYGTVSPEMALKGWALTEIKKMGQLRAILKKLDASVKQGHTIAIVVRQILSYMNSHPDQHEKFSKFAEYSRRCRPVVRPCWLDPSSDILLVKPIYDRLFHIGAK